MQEKQPHQETLILKPIKTSPRERKKEARIHKTEGSMEQQVASTSTQLEPLSPATRFFHAPRFNTHIICLMGTSTPIDPSVVKMGLEQTLLKHPRFSSKLVVDDKGRKTNWERTTVNLDDHIILPNLEANMESPDQFIEDYVSHLTTVPMDMTKPLWELHILNVKTSEAEAVGIFRIHHSIGDGASLISLLLACTRKTSNPDELPRVPTQRRAGSNTATGFWGFVLALWTALCMMWYTFLDMILFAATILFLKDTKTFLKGGDDVGEKPKRLVHHTVSLDDIKAIKTAMNMTINDVLVGVTQAGLSRYLNRKYGENGEDGGEKNKKNYLPKHLRIRSTVLINLRPAVGIQTLADLMAKGSNAKWGWGNWIAYIILPFTIALQANPLDYLRTAKANVDQKKLSYEAICTYTCALIVLKIFGLKPCTSVARRSLLNTTFSFSNVVGPLEEISFYGHPIAYIAPSVYGHPQALTLHYQSYCNKMTIVAMVDPDVIPDPHQLCQDMAESLKIIKDAVLSKEQEVSSNLTH